MEIQSGKFTRIAGKRNVSYKYCSSLLIAVDYLKTFCDKVDLALFQVVTPKVLPKKVRCICAFAKIKEKHKIKTVTIFFIGFMYLFCKSTSAHRGFRYAYIRYKSNTFTLKTTLFG